MSNTNDTGTDGVGALQVTATRRPSAGTAEGGSESPADGQTPAPEGNDTGEQDTGSQKPNREARYRVERNEARESLAAAEARIERMQRAEVERLAGEHLAVGEDIFLSGADLASLLNEDGDVDAELVAEAARALAAERPRMGKAPRGFDPSQGLGGRPPKPDTPTFGDLFK